MNRIYLNGNKGRAIFSHTPLFLLLLLIIITITMTSIWREICHGK